MGKLQIGSLIRLALGMLAGYGVAISVDQSDAVIKAVEQILAALSVVVPIIWSIWKNWKVTKALNKK